MASLLIGAVGGYFFGPIGFLVGSAIGNALFPQRQEGPKLSDLKLQSSTYGAMIPIPYGTVRLSPQVVWQTDLEPHEHEGGGKGGPEVVTTSYSASFAVKLCKGPIMGVLQIFADGTLIYDTSISASTDNAAIPATFYLGDNEDELPNPTMEAELGVGNVPAFRDDAAIVFTDWDLSAYGNRLPNLSVVVYTATSGEVPDRMSTWEPPHNEGSEEQSGYQISGASFADGVITIGQYNTFDTGPVYQVYTEFTFDLDGNQLSESSPVTLQNQPCDDSHSNNTQTMIPWSNAQGGFSHLAGQGGGNEFASAWWVKDALAAWPVHPAVGTESFYACIIGCQPFLYTAEDPNDSALYCIGGDHGNGYWVARYPAPNGIPSGTPSDHYAFTTAPGTYQVTVGDGYVWVIGPPVSNGNTWAMLKLTLDLGTVVHQWDDGDLPATAYGTPFTFMVSEGRLFFGAHADVYLYTINGDNSFTLVGSLPVTTTDPQAYPTIQLTTCLALGWDGVIQLCQQPGPVILGSIIDDVSERCGFDVDTELDTSEQTQLVDGYTLTQQGDGRAALGQLQRAYYVDAVESSDVVRWVNRGGSSVVTIPDDDLAAYAPGSQPPPLAEVKRGQEVDLPALVSVNYLNEDAGYQVGTQEARRQVTRSQSIAKVDLAIVMTDSKAKQISNVLLYEAWMNRTPVTISLPRKYAYLEPTDVIEARNYALRVQRQVYAANGIVQLECVETLSDIYTSAYAGVATLGYSVSQAPSTQATQLVLLDIPLVEDDDLPLYAAMAGAANDRWPGATLYKSIDDGASYNSIGTQDNASIIGAASNSLATFGGGNQFDESGHVTVVIGRGGGELAGATQLAVLNGANLAVLGSELIQFKNAELIATGTYVLSGLLRGRRGTEWAMASHVPGERFVMLPVPDDALSGGEIGLPRIYKPVTRGTAFASASPQSFTDTGVAWKPYAPVQLGGGVTSGDDVILHWTRRTRIGGRWTDGTDVPLGESSEQYIVQIWDAAYSVCARVVTGVTTPTFVYTAAMQTADFGGTQEHVYFTVGQVGSYGLGYQSAGIAPGGGSGDDAPLSPVTPYGMAPPSGSGGLTPDTLTEIVPGVRAYNLAWQEGDNWVLQFETPASGTAHITTANYLGNVAGRRGTLSSRPGGDPLGPGCSLASPSMTFTFFVGSNPYPSIYPTLAPSTTYYITMYLDAPSDGYADYITG